MSELKVGLGLGVMPTDTASMCVRRCKEFACERDSRLGVRRRVLALADEGDGL